MYVLLKDVYIIGNDFILKTRKFVKLVGCCVISGRNCDMIK